MRMQVRTLACLVLGFVLHVFVIPELCRRRSLTVQRQPSNSEQVDIVTSAMPCPFGFVAEDAGDDGADEAGEDSAQQSDAESIDCRSPAEEEDDLEDKQKARQKAPERDPADARFDADPMEWFRRNKITSEQDFEAKKSQLQQEARRRLDALKIAKQKLLEFDSDLDEDSLDEEFSDMDNDANSLSSFGSHAQRWLQRSKYNLTSEACLKYAAPAALAVTMVCVFQSYNVWGLCKRVGGVVVNTEWPVACFSASLASSLFVALAYASTFFRSKRMLLTSSIGLVLLYSAAVALLALMHAKPTSLDEKLFTAACQRTERTEVTSRLCTIMPTIRRDVAEALPPFISSMVTMAGCAFGLVVLSIWYMLEMAYVEKKAAKQKRRERRSKHTIPWNKIKLTSAATASWVASDGAVGAGSGAATASPEGAKDVAAGAKSGKAD